MICGAVEYGGGTESQAMSVIHEKINANTIEVLEKVKAEKLAPRDAALNIAQARVREASQYRHFAGA